MIPRPTVFVLGAGASHPYGFSLGRQLLEEVGRDLLEPTCETELSAVVGDVQRVRDFGRLLRDCGRSSIDAFLDTRPEFLDVGKAAIARALSEQETDSSLLNTRGERWYHYLFDKTLGHSVEEFRKNQLSVVTFNFDRSFERALIRSLVVNYPVNEEQAVELAKSVPMFYIHGQLGPLWQTDGEAARPYGPLSTDPHVRRASLQTCARQIRIVQEEVKGPVLDAALRVLAEAEVVCFLGFGYRAENLERLKVHKLSTPNKLVYGTTMGMYKGERDKAKSGFPNITLYEKSVLGFLQETTVIHG